MDATEIAPKEYDGLQGIPDQFELGDRILKLEKSLSVLRAMLMARLQDRPHASRYLTEPHDDLLEQAKRMVAAIKQSKSKSNLGIASSLTRLMDAINKRELELIAHAPAVETKRSSG